MVNDSESSGQNGCLDLSEISPDAGLEYDKDLSQIPAECPKAEAYLISPPRASSTCFPLCYLGTVRIAMTTGTKMPWRPTNKTLEDGHQCH